MPWPKTPPCERFVRLVLSAQPALDVTWHDRRYHAPEPGENHGPAPFDVDEPSGGRLAAEKVPESMSMALECADGGELEFFFWQGTWSWKATYYTPLDGGAARPRDEVSEILGEALRVVDTACRRVSCSPRRREALVRLLKKPSAVRARLLCTDGATQRRCELQLCNEENLRIVSEKLRDNKGESLQVQRCGPEPGAHHLRYGYRGQILGMLSTP